MATFDIDGDLVRKLADLLRETGLTEVEFAEGERRIRVTRATAVSAVSVAGPMAAAQTLAAPAAVAGRPGASAPLPAGTVTSPMVGTAYIAPEPSSPPCVRVGETVKAGQTIMIIEAMKVMNPIKAPRNGTVTQVMVTDAQPVEFGEPLLVIE